MTKWIKAAAMLPKIARESDLIPKKVAAKEIFGSNLALSFGNVRPISQFHPQNHWSAVVAAREKIRTIPESRILVGKLYTSRESFLSANFELLIGRAEGGFKGGIPPHPPHGRAVSAI